MSTVSVDARDQGSAAADRLLLAYRPTSAGGRAGAWPGSASARPDFLEYLGTWAEGDDEWLAIEEFRKDLSADAKDAGGAERAKGPEDTKESETERDDDHEGE